MNKKILFGIIVPLVLLVALTILSNLNIGVSINFNPVKSLDFNELFGVDYRKIILAKLTIENNFFLPRSIEVENYKACFYSTQNGVAYNRDIYLYFTPIAQTNYYGGEIFSDGNNQYLNNIPVKQNDKIEAELYMQNIYDSRGEQKVYYLSYDKILLFKYDKNRYEYDFCSKVSKEDIKNAVSIDVINRPSDTGFGGILPQEVRQDKQKQPPFIPVPAT